MSEPIEKVKNRLPPRPRLVFGPYQLIPVTDYGGYVIPELWCVPGQTGANNPRARATTSQLCARGNRIGFQVRVLI